MEKYTLKAQLREERGHKARRVALRRIPATVYGQDDEALAVWVDAAAFARVLREAGETGVIELAIDDKKAVPTIVRAVQYEPLKHTIIHADFYRVNLKEEVTTEIPVVLTGEAPAAKLGGTLMQNVSTLEVRALPSDLPHEIAVDVSALATFDDTITVADITAPAKVTILSDPQTAVVTVAAPRVTAGDEEDAEATDAAPAEDAEAATDAETA